MCGEGRGTEERSPQWVLGEVKLQSLLGLRAGLEATRPAVTWQLSPGVMPEMGEALGTGGLVAGQDLPSTLAY